MADTPSNVVPFAPRPTSARPKPRAPRPEQADGDPDTPGTGLTRHDPIQAPTPTRPQARCKAHTRSGGQCRNAPVLGAAVCRMHGGAAPQVKRRAALRLLELVDPAVATLAREMANAPLSRDRQHAANSILDRAGMTRRDAPAKEDVYDLVAERLRQLREQAQQ